LTSTGKSACLLSINMKDHTAKTLEEKYQIMNEDAMTIKMSLDAFIEKFGNEYIMDKYGDEWVDVVLRELEEQGIKIVFD